MYLYDVDVADQFEGCLPEGSGLAGPFRQGGSLRRFSPSELIFTPEETVAILSFFWPDMDMSRLGAVTDTDRGFAQGLLLEAVDASCTMGIVESIYKKFFMKVPTGFKSIAKSAAKIVLKALRERWFGRCRNVSSTDVKVYESVRRSLARNFRSPMQLRLETGELIY